VDIIIKTYRHSPTYKIQIAKFLEIKRKFKKKHIIFERRVEFLWAGMKGF
jgi:hypothetical protein